MATELSRLFVSVGADIGDLERKMAKAAASVNGLTKAQQAAANNPALQNALVKMGAVAATTSTAVGAVAVPITNAGKASATSAVNVARLRGAMTSLATSALQTVPGVVGLSSALGGMAIGAAPMVAVLAGLAAAGWAYNALTKDAKAAAAAVKESTDELAKLVKLQRQGLVGSLTPGIVEAQNEVERLSVELRAIADAPAAIRALSWNISRMKELLGLIAEQNLMITTGEKKITELVTGEINKQADARADAAKKREEAAKKFFDAEKKRLEALAVLQGKVAALAGIGSAALKGKVVGTTPVVQGRGATAVEHGLAGEGAITGSAAPRSLREFGSQMAGAGSIGEMFKVVGSSLGMLVKTALPLAALFKVFEGAMKPLQPVLEMFAAPLERLGEILGKVLVPAVMFAGDVIFKVAGGIAIGVGKIISGIFGVLSKIPLIGGAFKGIANFGKDLVKLGEDMWNWQDAFAVSADGLTESANAAAEALSNVPTGFKVALARFNATQGRALPTAQAGVVISGPIYVTSPDPKETLKEIEREAMRKANRGGSGLTLGYAG